MVGHDELALRVEGQTVGSELPTGRRGARAISRRPQEDRERLALLPSIDRVLRDVAEQQVAAAPLPHGSFGPVESLGELLDLRLGRHERVERGVEPLDLGAGGGSDRRRLRGVLRERRGRGEDEREGDRSDMTGHEPDPRKEFAGWRGSGGKLEPVARLSIDQDHGLSSRA